MFNITENSSILGDCFKIGDNLENQFAKWLKKLNGLFHQSFRKIRTTNKLRATPLSMQYDRKFQLKDKVKSSGETESVMKELDEIEKEIA